MNNLKNKKVIITGGSRGIGLSVLEALYKYDAKILTIGSNSNNLENLKKNFPNIIVEQLNLKNQNDIVKQFPKFIETLGGIDVLINNAGITKDNLTLRMKEEEWKDVIDVNLNSVFFTCQIAIKAMIKNKSGSIVNITSVVGHTGNAGQANYTASKAGVVAMTKSLAKEYAKKNIRVNCVSPGFIATDMTKDLKEEYKNELLKNIPINRLGTGNDIANAVIFLCSDNSSYITGETIHVNGGMYMA
ncbi:3-oxoacyl-[acyl-carrier-protein] reductase [alpha proteobacterium HIMB114]|nr:3-oxoacyl-[acyl-carrier-protein] reductase [alpha proteobacterium HIMB114]